MAPLILAGAVAAWAAVHSWLATNGVKHWTRRIAGEGVFRGYGLLYNLFSVISMLPLAVLWWRLPDRQLYSIPAPWSYVLLGAQAVAALLVLCALVQTGPLAFAGLAQLLSRPIDASLVKTGLYKFVRHPFYLFGLAIIWLAPIMSLNQLAVSLVLTIYFFVGAWLEEKRLVQEFGAEYEQYRATTPMIVPWITSNKRGPKE